MTDAAVLSAVAGIFGCPGGLARCAAQWRCITLVFNGSRIPCSSVLLAYPVLIVAFV